MDTNKNSYTIIYSIVMVVIVAAVLAFVSLSLKDKQNENISNEKQQYLLASVGLGADANFAEVIKEQQNGVQNGGPNVYALFWLRKYWYLASALALALLFLILKLKPKRGRKKKVSGGKVLIIDTNVWMDDQLRPWFGNLEKKLKKNGWVILLESIVLGELKGLSKNEEKRKLAQLGMSRIERLQNELGKQFRMEDNSTAKDTIADTVLMRTAARLNGSMLITNDKELRILARSKGIIALRSGDCQF